MGFFRLQIFVKIFNKKFKREIYTDTRDLVRLRTLRGKWICTPDRVLHALLLSALALCQNRNGYISSFSSLVIMNHPAAPAMFPLKQFQQSITDLEIPSPVLQPTFLSPNHCTKSYTRSQTFAPKYFYALHQRFLSSIWPSLHKK